MSARPPRRHPVLRGLAAVSAASVLLVSVGGYAAARRYDAKIERVDVFSTLAGKGGPRTPQPVQGPLEPMNVLLVGVDNRDGLTDEEKAEWHLGKLDYGNQTDTIMVVHIGRDARHVTVVSLPRDSPATIPEYTDADGTTHEARRDKINAAFPLGGPQLLVRTVEEATGIPIDHYVGVSFKGFVGMVDAVDGVDVCLDEPIKDNPAYTSLDLPAGRSTLRGGMALSFVRARHVGTDFGRIQRQQQFLASMLQKATSLGIVANPVRLDSFVSSAAESLTVDETLDRERILSLASRLSAVKLSEIEFARLPIADDNYTDPETGRGGYVTWKEEGARAIFDAIVRDVPLVVAKPTAPASATPTPAVPPAQIQVRVYNGSDVDGLATTVSGQLEALGYDVVAPADTAPDDTAERTVVRYPSSETAALQTLRRSFPDAEYVPVSTGTPVFDIILGSAFTAVVDPSAPAPPEATVPPADIAVAVLNGSGVGGRGTEASDRLAEFGFQIAREPDTSPDPVRATTLIRYDPSRSAALVTVQQAFPGAVVEAVSGLGDVVEITVGSGTGEVVEPRVAGVPSPSPSATPADPSDISVDQPPVVASTTVCT